MKKFEVMYLIEPSFAIHKDHRYTKQETFYAVDVEHLLKLFYNKVEKWRRPAIQTINEVPHNV